MFKEEAFNRKQAELLDAVRNPLENNHPADSSKAIATFVG
jgi:hypothetical protein